MLKVTKSTAEMINQLVDNGTVWLANTQRYGKLLLIHSFHSNTYSDNKLFLIFISNLLTLFLVFAKLDI